MDPLSDVLSLLKPTSYMSGGFDGGENWSIQFGPHEGIKFQAMISGGCWLAVEGVAEPVYMGAGDCLLLPRGRPFRLASDLAVPAIDAAVFLQTPLNGLVRTIHGGGSCFSVGGRFTFAGKHSEILLGALPPIVHIQKESDKAAMRWALERLMLELREPQPGGDLVAQQLAYIMLVQALRLHVTEGLRAGVGWLFALADKQMSAAMHCMHEDPAHRWTLPELAERAGMARSSFALKFKQTVGASPMDYLTRWRMMVAADRLTTSGDSVSVLAAALGYESESAFSTAFKRVMGCAPRQYGRGKSVLAT
ncbi:AraC family transcriptional regulator [Rhodoferax sp.]|uniref:AraC family transcriptional regulator n=1 Tax=Rhodoferax sp. TaxID=50421 RepID=UPI00374C9CC4